MLVRWETACEIGTAGFHVERLDPVSGGYERVNETVLPALLTAPRGGFYSLVDPGATPGKTTHLPARRAGGLGRPARSRSLHRDAGRADRTTHADDDRAGSERGRRGPGLRRSGAGLSRGSPAPRRQRRHEESADGALVGGRGQPGRGGPQPRSGCGRTGSSHASVAQLAQALGSTEAGVRAWLRTGALELTSKGEPVAWLPDTATQGAAEPSGLFFYGEAIDSLFTRDNVYRVRASFKGTVMEPVRRGCAAPCGRRLPSPTG